MKSESGSRVSNLASSREVVGGIGGLITVDDRATGAEEEVEGRVEGREEGRGRGREEEGRRGGDGGRALTSDDI